MEEERRRRWSAMVAERLQWERRGEIGVESVAFGDWKEESAEREQGKGAEIVGSTTTEREWRRGSNDGWSVTEAEEEEGGEASGVTVAAVTKNREEKAGDGGEVKRKGEGVEVRRGWSVAFGGQKGEAEKGQGRRTVERGTIGDGNGRKKMEEQQRRVTMVEAMAVMTNDAGDDHGDEKRRKGRGGREKNQEEEEGIRWLRQGGGGGGERGALGAVLHRSRLCARGRCAPHVVTRAHVALSGHTTFYLFIIIIIIGCYNLSIENYSDSFLM